MEAAQIALAARVKAARKAVSWTQDELADAAGVSRGTVSNFERKITYPHADKLRAILGALHMDALPERSAHEGTEPFDICTTCQRIAWPVDYEMTFDIIGTHMRRMTDSQRLAYMRQLITPLVHQ